MTMHWTKRIPGVLGTGLIVLSGCASMLPTAPVPLQDNSAGQPSTLYITVNRAPDLPEAFITVFKQVTQEVFPKRRVIVDDRQFRNQVAEQANRILMVWAHRIHPDYTYTPFDSSLLNGLNDCLLPALPSVLVGLLFAPCSFSGERDFMEATISDTWKHTRKTYQVEAGQSGFVWLPLLPFLPLTLDTSPEQERWKTLTRALYQQILEDQALN